MKIAFIGKLRSGKTTAMNLLINIAKENGIELTPAPLATPIYQEAKAFYTKHGLIWKKDRDLLQSMGRALNEETPDGKDKIVTLWDKEFGDKDNIVVEDCRRLTQVEYLKSKGFVIVKIMADNNIRRLRCNPGEWSEGHITDTELDYYEADFFVLNGSRVCLEELEDVIKSLFHFINKTSVFAYLKE